MERVVLQIGAMWYKLFFNRRIVVALYVSSHVSCQVNGAPVTFPSSTCIYDESGFQCPWCGLVAGTTAYAGAPGQINWDYCSCCGNYIQL